MEKEPVKPFDMKNVKILGGYMLRNRTNEGYAAKVYWKIYDNGTALILKRVLSKIPDVKNVELIRKIKD